LNVDYKKRPAIEGVAGHTWLKQTGGSNLQSRKNLAKYYR